MHLRYAAGYTIAHGSPAKFGEALESKGTLVVSSVASQPASGRCISGVEDVVFVEQGQERNYSYIYLSIYRYRPAEAG